MRTNCRLMDMILNQSCCRSLSFRPWKQLSRRYRLRTQDPPPPTVHRLLLRPPPHSCLHMWYGPDAPGIRVKLLVSSFQPKHPHLGMLYRKLWSCLPHLPRRYPSESHTNSLRLPLQIFVKMIRWIRTGRLPSQPPRRHLPAPSPQIRLCPDHLTLVRRRSPLP